MRTFIAIGAVVIAVAMPLSTGAATSTTARWAGYWQVSCWAKAHFNQHGTKVKGSFTMYAGTMAGTARGRRLTGTWAQPYYNRRGSYVWTMSTTGKAFHGHWRTRGGARKSCSGTRMTS